MEKQPTAEKGSYLGDVFGRFKAHKLALMGFIILTIEILCVFLLPFIFRLDPYTSVFDLPFGSPPVSGFILGTDDIGRDNFARFLSGGQVSMIVGLISSTISLLIGVPLGLIAGYFRGTAEMVIMRLADIFMSFPSMVLILVLVSVLGQSIATVIIVIGILGWPSFARLIYGNVLSVREKEYVEAARAIGTESMGILMKYVLPNTFSPALVAFTFRCAQAIIIESSLSFLGLGVQPPQASWGNILFYAQSISILSQRPWFWLPPGIALMLTVLSINFVGDGIRDALDTKMVI